MSAKDDLDRLERDWASYQERRARDQVRPFVTVSMGRQQVFIADVPLSVSSAVAMSLETRLIEAVEAEYRKQIAELRKRAIAEAEDTIRALREGAG